MRKLNLQMAMLCIAIFISQMAISQTQKTDTVLKANNYLKANTIKTTSESVSSPLRIGTSTQYVDIGPINSSFSHFYTNLPAYYFDKEIRVNTGYIGSYDENLSLRAAGSTKMTVTIGGNVGIGTATPQERLHVYGGNLKTSYGSSEIILNPHYYVGGEIPYRPYVISSLGELTFFNPNAGQYNKYILIKAGSFESQSSDVDSYIIMHPSGIIGRNHRSDSRASISINTNGSATFSGKVTALEIEVKPNVWSDFVFKKEYNLPPLEEVSQYIAEHGHLSDVPSETEVIENGINLGEMNAILLQKIEELTLYTIKQQELIETQNARLRVLEERINSINQE